MTKKKKLLLSGINALLLILIIICLFFIHKDARTLQSQQAAEVWKGQSKDRYAQISCFMPVNDTVELLEIMNYHGVIDKKLIEAGVKPPVEGKQWRDAFSSEGSVSVTSDRGSFKTTAIGVGGDYFMFHPYTLLSGTYLSDTDVMKDRVLLDYELAWKLFGGTDLDGMSVKIGGKPFYIAGVVRRETDKFSNKAFTGEPVIFMSHTALSELSGDDGLGISCYELVMPDPITGFAKAIAKESFPLGKGVVVENSTRYNFGSIYGMFKNFGSRSVVNNGVSYPYWENAARISEVNIARLYVFILILGAFPFVCLSIIAVKFTIFLIKKLKRLAFLTWDAWDDRYGRREKQKQRRALKKQQESENPEAATKKQLRLPRFPKRKAKQKTEKIPPKKSVDDYDEKAIEMDIESIVREMLSNEDNSDTENK
ncbi:MAG: ABC transporter permease [Oscillospiraceae bacterium]